MGLLIYFSQCVSSLKKTLLEHIVLENKDYLFSKNWESTNCNCQGAFLRLGRRSSQVKRHTQICSLQWTWPVLFLHRFLRNAIANTSMTAQSNRDLFFHSVEVQNQGLHGSCFCWRSWEKVLCPSFQHLHVYSWHCPLSANSPHQTKIQATGFATK